MSAKRAKLIRKLLKQVVGEKVAAGEKISAEPLYLEEQKKRKHAMIAKELGAEPESTVIAAGTIHVTTSSARGVYKVIKKQLKGFESKLR